MEFAHHLGHNYNKMFSGVGFLSELGVRYDEWEVLGAVDWFDADGLTDEAGDLMVAYGGINGGGTLIPSI